MTETTIQSQEDNLVADILHILEDNHTDSIHQKALLDTLIPYLVERDHKLFTHAYEAGRASA